MLSGLRERHRRRRAEQVGADIHAWFRGATLVLDTCGRVIDDRQVGHGEIGSILDRTDRTLFGLRDSAAGLGRSLHKREPELARKLSQTSQKIIELRNLMARFLIHAQGPTPSFLEAGGETSIRDREAQYSRALHEDGLAALRLKRDLDEELQRLWRRIRVAEPEAVAGLPDAPKMPSGWPA